MLLMKRIEEEDDGDCDDNDFEGVDDVDKGGFGADHEEEEDETRRRRRTTTVLLQLSSLTPYHTHAHTHTPVAPKWRAAIGEKLREAEDIKLFSHKYRGPSLQIFGSK